MRKFVLGFIFVAGLAMASFQGIAGSLTDQLAKDARRGVIVGNVTAVNRAACSFPERHLGVSRLNADCGR
jgi:hypothetical protein